MPYTLTEDEMRAVNAQYNQNGLPVVPNLKRYRTDVLANNGYGRPAFDEDLERQEAMEAHAQILANRAMEKRNAQHVREAGARVIPIVSADGMPARGGAQMVAPMHTAMRTATPLVENPEAYSNAPALLRIQQQKPTSGQSPFGAVLQYMK